MLPTLSPQEFVAKWRKTTLKESAAAQEHFIDLCHLVGHPTPAEEDPTGQIFTFEAGATKQRGGQGWADVWKKGHFAWEYKGKHKDLDRAYQQLLQYRESLLNPPLLIVSDIEQIIIHTNFTNTVKRVVRIELDDLLAPEGLAQLRAVFYEPKAFRAPHTTEQVTEEAASKFAHLADLLRAAGAAPQEAAHFLIRLLFCLFAEDTGLLAKDVFTQLVKATQRRPDAFQAQLRQLFQAMATGGWFGSSEIAHFDGRIFDDDQVLALDGDGMDILAQVSTLDWSYIEPSIFGTLFERSLDPSKRSQLGAHYTSREDILLILEPVLMAPLRSQWGEVKQQARDLVQRRDEAVTKRTRDNRQQQLTVLLTGFATEIGQVRVLDPACGSGNFLYVALKQLLDLEKEVVTLAGDLGVGRFFPSVNPAQVYGIEINEYAHELAQATIWIGYIQWLHENGFGLPGEPILKPLNTIQQMDAILTYDENRNPLEPEWPAADVVIGNPPFLGNKRMRAELGAEYVDDLRDLYADRLPKQIDLVCYWFEKARAMIASGKLKRSGLLATQAIRAGASRRVLERIKETGDLFYAQADRPWILDGADVRVSMVGFDNGTETHRLLNERVDEPADLALESARDVDDINANLTAGADLTRAKRLSENSGICFQGPVKVGPFDLEDSTAQQMLRAPNPHGRPNSEVVKPWMNARDVTRRPQKKWIIDFGERGIEEASLFELPFEYVKQHVKPMRDRNNDRQRRMYWWRLGRSGRDLKEAKAGKDRIIITPRVAKHRLFEWASVELVPDSRLFAFADDSCYLFGVLHSRIHEVWSLATSSRHGVGNDPTYNNTTCFETFPFPWSLDQEPASRPRVQAIAQAARELVEKRDAWLNPEGVTEKEVKRRTLTNLYNQRPTWLDLAHRRLDEAVLDAYGWPHELEDEEMLERLLALNLERASA